MRAVGITCAAEQPLSNHLPPYTSNRSTLPSVVLLLQDRTKLPDEATEMTGCIFCSPEFTPLVEKDRAIAHRSIKNTRPTRGRGKGKTRGRPRPPKDKMAQLAAYFV